MMLTRELARMGTALLALVGLVVSLAALHVLVTR